MCRVGGPQISECPFVLKSAWNYLQSLPRSYIRFFRLEAYLVHLFFYVWILSAKGDCKFILAQLAICMLEICCRWSICCTRCHFIATVAPWGSLLVAVLRLILSTDILWNCICHEVPCEACLNMAFAFPVGVTPSYQVPNMVPVPIALCTGGVLVRAKMSSRKLCTDRAFCWNRVSELFSICL